MSPLTDFLSYRPVRVLATLLLIIGSITALYFASQLQFDEHQEDLFRTDAQQFARYQHYIEKFPAEQQEISILIQNHSEDSEQDELLSADNLSSLLATRTALERLQAVKHVVSIFAIPRLESLATQASDDDDAALTELRRKLANPGYWPGKLVSRDQDVMVLVVALATDDDQSAAAIKELLQKVNTTLQDTLAGTSLRAQITGFPSLRIALRDQIKSDTVKYTLLAFFLSTLVAFVYFRSVLLVVATLVGPLSAVIWVFGLMSAAGLSVNVLTQMVGVLILVVTYTDALHLIAHCRKKLLDGLSVAETLRTTLDRVGPACLLTSLTSAAGFVSLALSNSPTIVQFGVLCAVGSLTGFVAVMLSLPAIVVICQRQVLSQSHKQPQPKKSQSTKSVGRLFYLLDSVIIIAGILLTSVFLLSATQLKTDYSFTENLPQDHPARSALTLADDSMEGQLPLHVMLQWSADAPVKRREMITDIRTLQTQLNESTNQDWISISELIRLAPGFGTLSKLKQLPPFAVDHFFLPKDHVAVVTTHMTSAGAQEVRTFINTIKPVLDDFNQVHPKVTAEVAGFLALVGEGSQYMISDLGKSLFGAIIIIFVLNVTLFRSLKLGLISLMPNVAPIAAVGAALVWSGEPLRYSSVVLFSICLGLAIDDTVHYLVRFRQHRKAGLTVTVATQVTSREVGRVLILTTLIMCAGFGALLVSTTPAIISMGMLACVALVVALISDLVLLPALLRRINLN